MPPPKVSLVPVTTQCSEERCMAVRPGFVRLVVNKIFKELMLNFQTGNEYQSTQTAHKKTHSS